MSQDPEKTRIVGNWLADLVDLTSPGQHPLSDRKITLYVQQLADIFPSNAFTPDSLRHAVFEQQYFPPFDVLRARIAEWWDENQPRRTAISSDNSPRLEAIDHHWIAYFHRRRSELSGDPNEREALANLARLVRAQSPKAWRNLSGEREADRSDATPEQRAYVQRIVEGMTGRKDVAA